MNVNHIDKIWGDLSSTYKELSEQGLVNELRLILETHWPDLSNFRKKTKDSFDIKEAIIFQINDRESSTEIDGLEYLLACIIDYGNKEKLWSIEITPFTVECSQPSSPITPFNFAGSKVIEKLDTSFVSALRLQKGSSYNPEKILGLIVYGLIRECGINNLSRLKNIFSVEFGLKDLSAGCVTISEGGNDFSNGKNRVIIIKPITQLLIGLYFRVTKENTLTINNCTSELLFSFLKMAIQLPKVKGGKISLTSILMWANFLNLKEGVPPLFCNYSKQSGFSYSIMSDVGEKNNKNPKLNKFSKSMMCSSDRPLIKNILEFSTVGTSKDNRKVRLTYVNSIKKLSLDLNNAKDNSLLFFEDIVAMFLIKSIEDKRNRSGKAANVQSIAQMAKRLFLFIEPFYVVTKINEIKLSELSESDFIELYDEILSTLPRQQASQVFKVTQKFHEWAYFNDYFIEVDFTALNAYVLVREERINAVLVTPEEYAEIKKTVFVLSLNSRDCLMLKVILFLALRLGLRRWELINLSIFDVQIEGKILIIRRHNQTTKTDNAVRKLKLELLPDDEYKELESWLNLRLSEVEGENQNAWLFTSSSEDSDPISFSKSTDKISKIMKSVLKSQSATIHWLRHACANWLFLSLEERVNPFILQGLDGFNSSEFHQEHRKVCAAVLLGHNNFERQDAWTGIYSVCIIMGHSHPNITMKYYIHVMHLLFSGYLNFKIDLVGLNIEYLLKIKKTKRVELFPKKDQSYQYLDEMLAYQSKKLKMDNYLLKQ